MVRYRKGRPSKGERIISSFLSECKIPFEKEKSFSNCNHKAPLRFDFYIPKYNLCIEYDGEQHFRPVRRFGGKKGFQACKTRDDIKFAFCLEHKISLLRIPSEWQNIPKIIPKFIKWLIKFPFHFFIIDLFRSRPLAKSRISVPTFF